MRESAKRWFWYRYYYIPVTAEIGNDVRISRDEWVKLPDNHRRLMAAPLGSWFNHFVWYSRWARLCKTHRWLKLDWLSVAP